MDNTTILTLAQIVAVGLLLTIVAIKKLRISKSEYAIIITNSFTYKQELMFLLAVVLYFVYILVMLFTYSFNQVIWIQQYYNKIMQAIAIVNL